MRVCNTVPTRSIIPTALSLRGVFFRGRPLVQPFPDHAISLSGFNSAAHNNGTLTAVHLAFHLNVTGNIKVTNNGITTASVTASDINTFKLASLPGVASSKTYTEAPSKHINSLKPTKTTTLSLVKTTTQNATPTSLAGYLTGSWTANAGDYGRTALTSGFTGGAVFSGVGGIKITATYDYSYSTGTPVPEPGSFALVGAGLVGLGVMRRRRRS